MQRCIAALADGKKKRHGSGFRGVFFVCMFRDLAGTLMRSEYTLGGGIATGVLRVEVIFKNALIRSCVENL
jgi:hypothetical protein